MKSKLLSRSLTFTECMFVGKFSQWTWSRGGIDGRSSIEYSLLLSNKRLYFHCFSKDITT